MCDLLRALDNSKCSMKDEENARQTANVEENVASSPAKKSMKRRYLNVRDRRMPWSLLPGTITQAEKARTLAVYIKLMSMNNYLQARQSINFASWPPPIQILEESTRLQPIRSTRSGRSVPIYADFDDDSSDLDFVVTKTKKRKVSNSEQNVTEGVYSNKIVSLKRKTSRDENTRPVKEAKITIGNEILSNNIKVKKDLFSIIED
ncbi:uncharacterized protein LOC115450005 isoform X2 [Manduca sexta]|uniref:Uncharacterized protein n=2 Tax=Manduca sexta TaxID=7130 RepID=A0A921ZLF0_MANSE|nr:uncharacterized protein LOC115450005 isoform X2 [Manduca sexta]XP_037298115.1 uncharacterized protein LOC115450005 isoform X2 [Manduca sexta]KAG6460195.1 hypothetical protein O3G_MSEX011815 [Manduca sexta]KAG6460196.1 hypothetical protein O3G_MSEX011815 [Manduca sexta]KAG6460197.1 hypothetical protein O3G_MSEX011815 [Manduca sexta]